MAFAKFYERHGDVANARVIFDKATQVELKYMDDLATVWCEWAEMELRHKNFKRALSLMQQATQPPRTLGTRQVSRDDRVRCQPHVSLVGACVTTEPVGACCCY